jgi:chromosome segregation ATPase
MSIAPSGKGKQDVDKFPVSKVDYTQPLLVKNSKVTFGEKITQVKEQHKDRLEDLIYEMDAVKRENQRLRRQQEDTYGVSMDTVDRMKKELERAKTTRSFLLEDIEVRKAKSEKMEADIFELNMKLESYTKKINELNSMKNEWIENSEKLVRTEEKCEKLSKVNKNLRLLLVKHHIDPKSVDFDSGKSKNSYKSERIPPKPILKHEKKKKPDAHTLSHKNSLKSSRSVGDLREVKNDRDVRSSISEDVRRHQAITSRRALGRGPPSYLGYYTEIHQNKVMNKQKFDTITLPKLMVA